MLCHDIAAAAAAIAAASIAVSTAIIAAAFIAVAVIVAAAVAVAAATDAVTNTAPADWVTQDTTLVSQPDLLPPENHSLHLLASAPAAVSSSIHFFCLELLDRARTLTGQTAR